MLRRPRAAPLYVVAAALVATLAACGGGSTRRPASVGAPAPPFHLANVREGGADVEIPAAGGKPVILNFWASWCDPCTREMPTFEAAHRRLRDRVTFLGVDRQDDRGDALRFIARTGVTYDSAYDPTGSLDAPYRLRGTPTTFVLGADGRVVDEVAGPVSASRLDGLLAEVKVR